MKTEPTYEAHTYHPTRKDGLDRNLRRINRADWLNGIRCVCPDCRNRYQSSRDYATRIGRRNPEPATP
jgi:hypothetical protein